MLENIKGGRWDTYRAYITKDARKQYKKANKPEKCFICGYKIYTEVCHIKAVADFEEVATLSEINSPDNLIRLCPNHHWEFDHKLIKLVSGEESPERAHDAAFTTCDS